jgi:NAD-dependent dihydropyrimidine dehydrogenase PreA subunit
MAAAAVAAPGGLFVQQLKERASVQPILSGGTRAFVALPAHKAAMLQLHICSGLPALRCKPKKCKQECKRFCPVVKIGKMCIEVTSNDRIAWISEDLCIGCGICVKVR